MQHFSQALTHTSPQYFADVVGWIPSYNVAIEVDKATYEANLRPLAQHNGAANGVDMYYKRNNDKAVTFAAQPQA